MFTGGLDLLRRVTINMKLLAPMKSKQFILLFIFPQITATYSLTDMDGEIISERPPRKCPLFFPGTDIKNSEVNCRHQNKPSDDLLTAFHRFRVHTEAVPWIEAVGTCWREGGRLATPADEPEERLLGRLLEYTVANVNISGTEMRDAMHIGVHDLSRSRYFTDITGQDVKYTPWIRSTDISPGLQYCVRILANGHYTANLCKEKLIFACDMQGNHNFNASFNIKKDDGYVALTGSSRYRLHYSPLPWLAAVAACVKDGATLADPVTSQEAKVQATTLFPDVSPLSDGIFIGLSDIVEEGVWRNTKGIINLQVPWTDEAPNGKRGSNCGVITRNGNYKDVPCKEARPFLCERKAEDLYIPKYINYKGVGHYAMHIKRKNWINAAFLCQSENATLAIPDSTEKVEALEKIRSEILREYPDLLDDKISIGVYGMQEGIRRTLNGYSFPELSNVEWIKSEEFYSNVFCGAFKGGKFHGVSCGEENIFVCGKNF